MCSAGLAWRIWLRRVAELSNAGKRARRNTWHARRSTEADAGNAPGRLQGQVVWLTVARAPRSWESRVVRRRLLPRVR